MHYIVTGKLEQWEISQGTKKSTAAASSIVSIFDIYPPLSCEILEDLYSTAALVSRNDDESVFAAGILFLSNYRLVFVENVRSSSTPASEQQSSCATMSIPIGDITDVQLVTQHKLGLVLSKFLEYNLRISI